jgi:EAL domain-containing protein (putative c-di-GMP-specific phosphodiesterase class I)
MVVINGTVYKLSINIQEGVIADDEDEACNEVLYRLKKAGFDVRCVEIEIIDSEPNVEDLD